MKTILKMNTFVEAILNKGQFKKNKNYMLSKFIKSFSVDGKTILYSNLTREIVELDAEEDLIIRNLPNLYNEKMNDLIDHHILVDEGFSENKFADSIFSTYYLLYYKKPFINDYTILPTSACNAQCHYCFEKGNKFATMNAETTKKTCEFISKNSKGQPLQICWFGGEPLCNIKAIDEISKYLFNNKMKYKSLIITNGLLFDANIVKRAKDLWNLKKAQITLDGTEKVYNRIKSYRDKTIKSPFKRVIRNIGLLLDAEIQVSVRLNVSEENYSDLFDLITFLNAEFTNKKENLYIYCSPLFDKNLEQNYRQARLDRVNSLKDYIASLDFNTYDLIFRERLTKINRNCMAVRDNSVVIGPTGRLGKCEHFYIDEHTYGSIYHNKIDLEEYSYWSKQSRMPICDDCFFYSSCSGLFRCPVFFERCDEFDRKKKHAELEEFLIKTYKQIKDEKREK